MQKPILDLASLLHPVSLEEFFSTYWETNWFRVQRGDEGFYRELLTKQNLEDIISTSDARYPAIMLAKGGVFHPAQAYCDDVKMGQVTFFGVPNLKKLSAEYGRGATIALTSLDRHWRPLSDLCLKLEEQLDHGIKTNIYLTAGYTAGFPVHYDTHDILVLQIAGRKLWRIHEPVIKLPDAGQPCDPKNFSPGPRLAEVELRAGDLLYLPRGYAHAATTSQSHSAHVTVGIHVYTWASILKGLDPSCVRAEEFRKSLPAGFASRAELRPAIREQLRRMAPERLSDSDLDRALNRFLGMVDQSRRRMPGRFRADVAVIAANSLLEAPSEARYHFSRPAGGPNAAPLLTLEFDGNRYGFPLQLEPVLDAMCRRRSFRLSDLPGGHSSEALVGLAGYLQSIGFLTVGAKGTGPAD